MKMHNTIKHTEILRYSGHDAFPCRVGWLLKLYDHCRRGGENRDDSLMLSLGIGSNMVRSIRFWSEAMGLFEFDKEEVRVTAFGDWLLNEDDGYDPYLDTRDSLWLLHWRLSSRARLAAWQMIFAQDAVRAQTTQKLMEEMSGKSKIVTTTIKQHINVFLRSYAIGDSDTEDMPGMPRGQMTGLSLITVAKEEGETILRVRQDAADNLSPRIWAIIMTDFWRSFAAGMTTMSKEWMLQHPYSPMKALPMSPPALSDNLFLLEEMTDGMMVYRETLDEQLLWLHKPLSEISERIFPNGY